MLTFIFGKYSDNSIATADAETAAVLTKCTQ